MQARCRQASNSRKRLRRDGRRRRGGGRKAEGRGCGAHLRAATARALRLLTRTPQADGTPAAADEELDPVKKAKKEEKARYFLRRLHSCTR